jgi:hypothetical protein
MASGYQGYLSIQDDKILSVSYAGPEGYCKGQSAPFHFPQYTALDTCNGIDKAVASLGHVVNSVSAKDKDARFDIIGHSLGGFVAAYWVAKLPPDDRALIRIHSVITLDSPLGDVLRLLGETRKKLQEQFPDCLPSGSEKWVEGAFKILEGSNKQISNAVENATLTSHRVNFVNFTCNTLSFRNQRISCVTASLPAILVPIEMKGSWRTITISGDLQDDAKNNPCQEKVRIWHCTILFHQDTLLQIKDIFDTEVIHDQDKKITRSGSWQEKTGNFIRGRTLDSTDPDASLKLSQVEGDSISVIYNQDSTFSRVLGSVRVDDQQAIALPSDVCQTEPYLGGGIHCKHTINLAPGLHDIELLLTAGKCVLCPFAFRLDAFEVKSRGYTPPSDPDDGSIELVSVSSHSVPPSVRFRPSVTVRVKTGELRQDRGDMLRCNDLDRNCDTNSIVRFGAFPHVTVEGTTGTDQTYTFTFYENDPMIAPGIPGIYTSNWRVWRAGRWVGPNIPITFRVEAPQPAEPTALTGDWELNYEIYRWSRSDGSTVEADERATIVARFIKVENGFTGHYIYVSGNGCVNAKIDGTVQGNQANWKTRFTGPPCQGAEVIFEGTLNRDGTTMTGTVSPIRTSPEGRGAWARVTVTKVTSPSVWLNPTGGLPHTEVTATGSGWSAGHKVYVQWGNTQLTATTVDDNGGFTVYYRVPDDAAEGQHTVAFYDIQPAGGPAYFVPATLTALKPDIPSLNARVVSLRFYESDTHGLPREQQAYAQRFASDTTRYINWVLDLEHPSPGRRINYKITAIYLRDNGTPLWEEIWRQTTKNSHVEVDWTWSYQEWSYGFGDPGNWEIGNYRVDIYVEGKKIASAPFEIYCCSAK